jgi:hypothetical protein
MLAGRASWQWPAADAENEIARRFGSIAGLVRWYIKEFRVAGRNRQE